MRKSFLLICIFSYCVAFGQSDTTKESKKSLPYYIEVCKDVMDDKEYAFGSKTLLCSEDGKKGFFVSISWKPKKSEVTYHGLTVVSAGVGTCNENDELIILFVDDTKYTLKSWQKFNCEGNSYFDLNHKYFDEFNTKKIKAIRLTNGRTFESFTYKPSDKEASFFIEAKAALDGNRIVTKKCDD